MSFSKQSDMFPSEQTSRALKHLRVGAHLSSWYLQEHWCSTSGWMVLISPLFKLNNVALAVADC